LEWFIFFIIFLMSVVLVMEGSVEEVLVCLWNRRLSPPYWLTC